MNLLLFHEQYGPPRGTDSDELTGLVWTSFDSYKSIYGMSFLGRQRNDYFYYQQL